MSAFEKKIYTYHHIYKGVNVAKLLDVSICYKLLENMKFMAIMSQFCKQCLLMIISRTLIAFGGRFKRLIYFTMNLTGVHSIEYSYLKRLSYLVQTIFGLFLKGVGKTSEKITRGISRRTKFRFSGSIGNVESFLSGSKDHSVIFFFS